ncbi:MAG: FAD-binding protein [Thermoleophilaceae bacterium]
MAAALDPADSPDRHLSDTLMAGRGLSRPSAAEALCGDSPARVLDLEELGVSFDRGADGSLALGLEGGHSQRRVVHAGGSATGRRITRELSALCATEARIEVLEGLTASALWSSEEGRCAGLLAHPTRRVDGPGVAVLARGTVLATGGAAALWERTTNPRGAIGAGLTLALAAGAALADVELVQFHPTALVDPGGADGFLVSEAVRGEGAVLRDGDGERFVDELAPRDHVAGAIHRRLEEACGPVSLDMRGMDLGHFPNIVARLRRAGFEPAEEPVPVAPAAHYTMGESPPTATGARRCGACSPSESARARESTVPTAWPRTRWPSASCSAAGRRRPPSRSRCPSRPRGSRRCRPRRCPHRPPAPRCGASPASSATRAASPSWPAIRSRWPG